MKHVRLPILFALFIALLFPSENVLAQPVLDWAKKVPGPFDMPSHLTNESGDIYCAGVFDGVEDFDTSPLGVFQLSSNNGKGFVVKMDSAGGFSWAVQFKSQHAPIIALDADGNVYVAGNTAENGMDLDPGPGQLIHNNTIPGFPDVFIVKLNTAGTFKWGKAMGCQYLDDASYLATDPVNGGVYLGGFFTGSGDFDPGAGIYTLTADNPDLGDPFILKLNAGGDFEWAFSAQFSMNGMGTDGHGDLLVGGSFRDTIDFDPGAGSVQLIAGATDGFLLKLSAAGVFQWVKQIVSYSSGNPYSGCNVHAVTIDQTGNIYMAGSYRSGIDFDPGPAVYQLPYDPYNFNSFVLKCNPAGDFMWARAFPQPITNTGFHQQWLDVCADAQGNVYCCGYFKETIDFDAGNGVFNLTSFGEVDMFLVKLLADGQFGWAIQIGGTGYDYGNDVNVGKDQQLTVTGSFDGTVDFNPGPGANFMSAGEDGGFLMKLAQHSTPVAEPEQYPLLVVYPSPAADYIDIRLAEPVEDGVVSISTTAGAVLSRQPLPADGRIDVSGLPPGAYAIRLDSQGKSAAGIFIKR